jgi:predicted esterase
MIQIHRFVTPKTTRFAQIGEFSGATKEVIFALHGYGQLAASFAQNLMSLASPDRVIICPEALSRFYTNHRAREAGATWMTSEDREFEIMDYVTYLDGLAAELMEEAPEDIRVEVFGFSQGCHTASRWMGNGTFQPARLILWGADPAHDLSPEEWDSLSNIMDITLVAGSNDEYLPEDRLIKAEETLRDHQCTFNTVRYDGKHEIVRDVLLKSLWA